MLENIIAKNLHNWCKTASHGFKKHHALWGGYKENYTKHILVKLQNQGKIGEKTFALNDTILELKADFLKKKL